MMLRRPVAFRRLFAFAVALIAVGAIASPCAGEASADTQAEPQAAGGAERPNILFVYTDDQAPYGMGTAGNAQIHTPHMNQLAEQGAYLPNAVVTTPVCSPARTTLLTGQYASEYGITDWLHAERQPDKGLDPAAVTWAEVFQDHGYQTGLVGKWHLGVKDRYHPTKQGFDYFMGFRKGGRHTKNPVLEKNGEKQQFQGLTIDILTDHAIKFLKRNRHKRFVLEVAYRAPHARYLPVADEDMAPYKNMGMRIPDYPGLKRQYVKRRTREYYAAISGVDRSLGRLLNTLRELDLKKNTVVVFTSDHGYNTGHHGVWYKGNAHWVTKDLPPATEHVPAKRRPNMFDTSLHVPLVVRWPGVIEPGSKVTEVVANTDWYPTLLDIAGLEVPNDVTIRGRSFLPLLKGRTIDWKNDLYGEYSMHHGAKVHMRMYRTRDWKLVRDFLDRSRDEFYHLAEDPHESNNLLESSEKLSPQAQQIIERFDQKIRETMRRIDDPVLKQLEDGEVAE